MERSQGAAEDNAISRGLDVPEDAVWSRVQAFLREEAGFAQVTTVIADGLPVGRTMVATVDDDWSVPLVQRRVHHRIGQWRENPWTEVVWVGSPHRDNRNLTPHVYDLLVQVPRVVFLRGRARFMDDAELLSAYGEQMSRSRSAGRRLAPERDDQEVVADLVGVRIEPVRVRVEGFGSGPESWTWRLG